MAKSKQMLAKEAAAAKKSLQQEAEKANKAEKENQLLREQLARSKKQLKISRNGGSASKKGTSRAMEKEVAKVTKTDLWKICKFFKNQTKAMKGTKCVMEKLELLEFEGLEGEKLAEAQEEWKGNYVVTVREALNMQRNYVQQELREVMEEKVFDVNKEAEFPNMEQMAQLVLRAKMDDATPTEEARKMMALFDKYWNVLIPKVAGNKWWPPSKRHHQIASYPEDRDSETDPPPVTPQDEAFCLLVWENCCKKWWCKAQCKRGVLVPYPDGADPPAEPPTQNDDGRSNAVSKNVTAGFATDTPTTRGRVGPSAIGCRCG